MTKQQRRDKQSSAGCHRKLQCPFSRELRGESGTWRELNTFATFEAKAEPNSIMNSSETQSEPKQTTPRYFDPEQLDNSEQQFAVSLEEGLETPPFFLAEEDDAL